jgi:hypothetical protein
MGESIQLGLSILYILSFVIGIGIVWGKLKTRQDIQGKQLNDLRRGLYREDGTLVYVTEKACATWHGECKASICAKIEELKEMIKETEEKREQDRQKLNKTIGEISFLLSRYERTRK